jgi:hypothetical protein
VIDEDRLRNRAAFDAFFRKVDRLSSVTADGIFA